MKRILLATIFAIVAIPAFAQNSPDDIATQSPKTGATAQYCDHCTGLNQTAATARASTKNSSNNTNTNAPVANGGAGGQGGTARSRSISSGNTVTNNLSSGGGNGGGTRAPDIALPSFGGGGMDCPTVGFGAAGSGLGGGGGFGPSWISTDCNARKLASEVWDMGDHDAAIAILHKQFPQLFPVREVPVASPVLTRDHSQEEEWCRLMNMSHTPVTGFDIAAYAERCNRHDGPPAS